MAENRVRFTKSRVPIETILVKVATRSYCCNFHLELQGKGPVKPGRDRSAAPWVTSTGPYTYCTAVTRRSPKRLTSNQQFLVKEKLLLASGNDKCTKVAVVAI
jgi:hypothetical protein